MPIVWEAVGASILPNIGGWLATPLTMNSVKSWYKTLNRPSWTPPDFVFGPVWTILYTAMGYASYLVWRDGGGFTGPGRNALILFAIQLALNWAWSPVFFGLHEIGAALIVIVVLWFFVVAAGVAMYRINKTAGLIMIPYLAWLSYATALNYSLWQNNPAVPPEKESL